MIKTERNQHDWAVATYLKQNNIKGGIIGYDKIDHIRLPTPIGKTVHHNLKGKAVLCNVLNGKKFTKSFSFTYYVDGNNKIIVVK